LAQRKGVQCRLAILALYFMSISEDMEDKKLESKEWQVLEDAF
jgi:hypothetical protein